MGVHQEWTAKIALKEHPPADRRSAAQIVPLTWSDQGAALGCQPCAVLAELEQRVGSVPASVLCLIRPVSRGIVQIGFTAESQTGRSHLRRERYASGPCPAGLLRAGMPNRL
jgi:hypothetical protein